MKLNYKKRGIEIMKEKMVENGIEYMLVGDYYIPNIKMDLKGFKSESKLGKYGRLRLNYLKNNDKVNYQIMIMNGTLYRHLQEVQNTAKSRVDSIIKHLAEQENVNEKLKTRNQLEWVRYMNNIKNRAEEIVLKEIVYEKN